MPSSPKRFQRVKPKRSLVKPRVDRRRGFRGHKRVQAKRRILERDSFTCQSCGRLLSGRKDSRLDHVIPLCDGGGHEDENLQSLCIHCHRDKSAKEQRPQ